MDDLLHPDAARPMSADSGHVLLVDDEVAFQRVGSTVLRGFGYRVTTAGDADTAVARFRDARPDVVLLDLSMPPRMTPEAGLELLAAFRSVPVVVLTGHADRTLALRAAELGAWDFLAKPIEAEMLRFVVGRAARQARLARELAELQAQQSSDELGLIGRSEAIRRLREMVRRLGPTAISVLVLGPTGTGKELVARALHQTSPRQTGPFVALHCGALPGELLESELFGHLKGSFTGAHQDRTGLLDAAHRGTLFLDEIGEMPLAMQVKLLRFLQEGTFTPVGGALHPLRPPACGSPLACHWQAVRRLAGPTLLDATLRPDRLVALPRERQIAVLVDGSEIPQIVSIEGGLAARVRFGQRGEALRGTPIAVPGAEMTLWVDRDVLTLARPNRPPMVEFNGQGRAPLPGIAVFELPRSQMLLVATNRGWMSVQGNGIRSGINPFTNRPPQMITALLDRGPREGVWIGSPEGIIRVTPADLQRPRSLAPGRKPTPDPVILTAASDGSEPSMGTVAAFADLPDGALLVGARGGLFLLAQGSASLSRHLPFAETGAVHAFHRWNADRSEEGPVLVEAEKGLFTLRPDGAIASMAGSGAVRHRVVAAPGSGRLFVPQVNDAPLLEVVRPGTSIGSHDCTALSSPAG